MQAVIFIEAAGKAAAWRTSASKLGLTCAIVATDGHVARMPEALMPLGLSITRGSVVETLRRDRPEARRKIVDAVSNAGSDALILLATDADAEGDVIALDIARIVLEHQQDASRRMLRIAPGALTFRGIQKALSAAQPIVSGPRNLVQAAVQGRARAASDRWIGGAFSKSLGVAAGRVRTALLGTAAAWSSDQRTRARPDTGELLFTCSSANGGLPFVARLGFSTAPDPVLIGLATRFEGRPVGGRVAPLTSVGAAVTPRYGAAAAYTTGQVLVHARRHLGLQPAVAMRGLQEAYMAGAISYPRTDTSYLSRESAEGVVQLAEACGLRGAELANIEAATDSQGPVSDARHEGLHPVLGGSMTDIGTLRRLVRKPLRRELLSGEDAVRDAMIALVARRAFEAALTPELVPGFWKRGGLDDGLTDEEAGALENLEWSQPRAVLPWGRDLTTGLRVWPTEAVLLEAMLIEELGRPSTMADHAEKQVESGEICRPDPLELPRPSPLGRETLKKLPKALSDPRVSRLIELAVAGAADGAGADEGRLAERMAARMMYWYQRLPEDLRGPLRAAIRSDAGAGRSAPAGPRSERPVLDPHIAPESEQTPEPAHAPTT